MKRLIAFSFSFFFIISFLTNCNEEKEIYSQRNHILNLVYHEYEESYNDSIAVFESSLSDIDRYMKLTSFNTTKISNEDIQRWNNQHENYKRIDWQKWGWNDIPLISEKEFPDYFEYSFPPPDTEITDYITVLYFSVPLVGKKNALLFVAKKSGKNSWNVDRIILKKTEGEWGISSKRNIITT